MNSWTYNGITWYYDPDFDLSSWKSEEQLGKYRLPTVQEALTMLDYNDPYPAVVDECPFKHIKSIWTHHSYASNKSFAIDLFTGQVYKSTKNNIRLLALIKK